MNALRRTVLIVVCIAIAIGSFIMNPTTVHASTEMRTSQDCIDYIKSVEGFSKYPYYDYGQYTVGYGTKCPSDKYNDYKKVGITDEEAEELLKEHLIYTEDQIKKYVVGQYGVELTQNQFDALVSFSFNVGTSWMYPNSVNKIKNALRNNATDEEFLYALTLYCNAGGQILPGLVTRRQNEANMFLNGVYSRTRNSDFGYVYYDQNGGSVTYKIQGYIISNSTKPIEDASAEGHTFMGWYTEVTGGKKVDVLTKEHVGTTLHARWDTEEGVDINMVEPVDILVFADEVNVRSGPGTNYPKVGQANIGDKLTITSVVYGTGLRWGKFDGGWICLDYTNYDNPENTELPKQEEPEQNEEKPIMKGTVKVSDSLRIRSGPGTNYETVGYLVNGEKIDIFETKDVEAMVWGRIAKNKWTSLSYVVTEKIEEETVPTEPPTEPPTESTEPTTPPTETTVPTTPPTEEPKPTEPEVTEPTTPVAPTVPPEPTTPPTEEQEPTEDTTTPPEETEPTAPPTPSETPTEPDVEEPELTEPTTPPTTEPEEPTTPPTEPPVEEETTPTEPPAEEEKPDVQEVRTGVVKVSDNLRVRRGPGTHYKVVGVLYNNQKVTITEQQESGGMTWGKIGEEQWISLSYVKLDANTVVAEKTTIEGKITADVLNVRSGSGTSYKIIGYLSKGTIVKVTEVRTINNEKWGKTSNGWISMAYFKEISSSDSDVNAVYGTIKADCLRVRSNAGTKYSIVGYLYDGAKVEILDTKKDTSGTTWGKIINGWISMDYVVLNK